MRFGLWRLRPYRVELAFLSVTRLHSLSEFSDAAGIQPRRRSTTRGGDPCGSPVLGLAHRGFCDAGEGAPWRAR